MPFIQQLQVCTKQKQNQLKNKMVIVTQVKIRLLFQGWQEDKYLSPGPSDTAALV